MEDAKLVWDKAYKRGMEKWAAGKAEHGGNLLRKECLQEAISEATDQVTYLTVHEMHVEQACHMLRCFLAGLTEPYPQEIVAALNVLTRGNVEGE